MIKESILKQTNIRMLHIIDSLKKNKHIIYQSYIINESKCANLYAIKVLKYFKEKGLTETRSIGTVRIISLTPKGEQAVNLINKIIEVLDK